MNTEATRSIRVLLDPSNPAGEQCDLATLREWISAQKVRSHHQIWDMDIRRWIFAREYQPVASMFSSSLWEAWESAVDIWMEDVPDTEEEVIENQGPLLVRVPDEMWAPTSKTMESVDELHTFLLGEESPPEDLDDDGDEDLDVDIVIEDDLFDDEDLFVAEDLFMYADADLLDDKQHESSEEKKESTEEDETSVSEKKTEAVASKKEKPPEAKEPTEADLFAQLFSEATASYTSPEAESSLKNEESALDNHPLVSDQPSMDTKNEERPQGIYLPEVPQVEGGEGPLEELSQESKESFFTEAKPQIDEENTVSQGPSSVLPSEEMAEAGINEEVPVPPQEEEPSELELVFDIEEEPSLEEEAPSLQEQEPFVEVPEEAVSSEGLRSTHEEEPEKLLETQAETVLCNATGDDAVERSPEEKISITPSPLDKEEEPIWLFSPASDDPSSPLREKDVEREGSFPAPEQIKSSEAAKRSASSTDPFEDRPPEQSTVGEASSTLEDEDSDDVTVPFPSFYSSPSVWPPLPSSAIQPISTSQPVSERSQAKDRETLEKGPSVMPFPDFEKGMPSLENVSGSHSVSSRGYGVRWWRILFVLLPFLFVMYLFRWYVETYSTEKFPLHPAWRTSSQERKAEPLEALEQQLRQEIVDQPMVVNKDSPLENALLIELQRMGVEVNGIYAPVLEWKGRKLDQPKTADVGNTRLIDNISIQANS